MGWPPSETSFQRAITQLGDAHQRIEDLIRHESHRLHEDELERAIALVQDCIGLLRLFKTLDVETLEEIEQTFAEALRAANDEAEPRPSV